VYSNAATVPPVGRSGATRQLGRLGFFSRTVFLRILAFKDAYGTIH
jgi:hypothetical protein